VKHDTRPVAHCLAMLQRAELNAQPVI
jgi:hypothetical protein